MIDTKALRSRVLDLAIRGKLTEQLLSDGTAEDLFPKKLKAIEDIPFDIPDNWKWCKGIDCFKPMESRKPTGDNFNYIDIDAIDNKHQKINQIRTVATKDAPSRASRAVFDGSTLFSLVRPYLRNIAFVDIADSNSIASTGFFVATSNGSIYPLYLYYMMISDYVVMGLNEFMKGDNSPSIRKGHIEQWLFPIPPLAEQKRIVERVEEIFRLLDTIDQAQEKYSADAESLKAKLITAGIQGKLTEQLPSDGTAEELYQQIQEEKSDILNQRQGRKDNSIMPVEDDVPFEIPENWKWIRFGETGFFRKGPFGSSLTKSMFVPKSEDSIKVYEQQHAIKKDSTLGTYYITKEYFNESMKGFEVLPGDIIISCAGTIGETYIMPDNIEKGIINQALMRVSVVPSIDKQFFLYYFNSQLKKSAKAGNGSAITNIPPFDVLKNLYFPLPPLAEQKRIAEVLERVLGALSLQ